MAIDKNTVKYVAHLARISLNDKELQLLSRQLEDIVNFIDKLAQMDITGVEPTSHILEMSNVFRKDTPKQSLTAQQALGNAPSKQDKFFAVPKVIE